MLTRASILTVLMSVVLFGCSQSGNPVSSSGSQGNVIMSVAFTNSSTPVGLSKVSSVTSADSIRIDSAIVVLAKIRFESNIDTVEVDTSSSMPFINIDRADSSATFWGPFVIHIHDTVAINFANKTLPPGTYTGIKFAVYRLGRGEGFEDSEHFNHPNRNPSDTAITNYSIAVWGSIYKNGTWVPFAFKDNQNLEFKVKGTFTISSATSAINIALNFNMGSWFVNPFNGSILDPTDMSFRNQMMIREAIQHSFENGRCGRWDDFREWGF
ncbi:MAG: hypothetical protein M1378_07115 [Bacteroidetes bacterium]|nr:hypothetical protein [Bacteroidota bacterium]MCL5034411.1 hypothetical protein [Bacteroidota bacterium]